MFYFTPSFMPKKINAKYFVYLYKHKHLAPRTISKSILQIYYKIHPNDIYTKLIIYIFFGDTNEQITCPLIFQNLLKYEKIVDCIKKNFFKSSDYQVDIKNLPTNYRIEKNKNTELSQNEIYEIFRLLLTIEINYHQLYLVDQNFLGNLAFNMENSKKLQILNYKYKISPLLCFLLDSLENDKFVIPYYKSFYYFLKAIKLEYREGLYLLHSNNLDYRKLEIELLYSKYKIINEYHRIFINFYPEIIYNCKIYSNRLEYFNNPLNLPFKYKILRTYLFCIPYYLKIINIKLNDSNFDILFRVIYIEKIFNTGLTKKWCKLLHLLILDNCNLLYVLLKRKFDKKYIKKIVKNVPSFHLAFDHGITLYKESGDVFYLQIIEHILEEYPVKEYFKKIDQFKAFFPQEFLEKFQSFFDLL